MSDQDCSHSHVKAEPNWSPDPVFEVTAYAFGVAVDSGDDRVQLKQALHLEGGDVVVVSRLSPADARGFAAELINGADIVDGVK